MDEQPESMAGAVIRSRADFGKHAAARMLCTEFSFAKLALYFARYLLGCTAL
jgi:hypothetical protein